MEADREFAAAMRSHRLERGFRRAPVLLGAAFVAFIALLLADALLDGRWLTAACMLAFLAICSLAWPLLRAALRPGPHLILDDRGLDSVFTGAIAWPDIVGAHLQEYHGLEAWWRGPRYYLQLCVRRPERYSLPFWMQRPTPTRHTDYGVLWFPLKLFAGSPHTVYRTALTLRRAHPAPFIESWRPDMPMDEMAGYLSERGQAGATREPAPTGAYADHAPAETSASDYADRLRELQDAGERSAESNECQRTRAIQRERRLQADERERRRTDVRIIAVTMLLALVAGYFLIDYIE